MHPPLAERLAALQADPDVLGVILFGSWARGNNRPDSDVDLIVIVRQGFRRAVERRGSQVFEIIYTTERAAAEFWQTNPDDAAELWGVGRVLFDRDGTVARLAEVGRAIRERGKPPLEPGARAHAQFDAHDQLRAAEALAAHDPATARMLLAAVVLRLSELHFDLRRRWTPPPKQRLAVIKDTAPELHALLAAFYSDAPLQAQLRAAAAAAALVFEEET